MAVTTTPKPSSPPAKLIFTGIKEHGEHPTVMAMASSEITVNDYDHKMGYKCIL